MTVTRSKNRGTSGVPGGWFAAANGLEFAAMERFDAVVEGAGKGGPFHPGSEFPSRMASTSVSLRISLSPHFQLPWLNAAALLDQLTHWTPDRTDQSFLIQR